MKRKAKRSSSPRPSRYSVCVSGTPLNRFACVWEDADSDLAGIIGHRIAAKTGRPVGIICMQNTVSKGGANPDLKSWIATDCLKHAPSLMEDYKDLATILPGNDYYHANARHYVTNWKKYWSKYVPQMIATKKVPDGVPWGSYPTLASNVTSKAAETYNVLVHPFSMCKCKGILFLTSPQMVTEDQGRNFGEQMSALANCWKSHFGNTDTHFFYTMPSRTLTEKITPPEAIQGKSTAIEIGNWSEILNGIEAAVGKVYGE